jgi:hypothetical protein
MHRNRQVFHSQFPVGSLFPIRLQNDDANLRQLHAMHVMVEDHITKAFENPTLAPLARVMQDSMKRNMRLGHVDEHASRSAFMLDPKERPANVSDLAQGYIMNHAVPCLVFRRFGDTSGWDEARLKEARAHVELKLKGQLNLYNLQMNPFCDDPVICADPKAYWESAHATIWIPYVDPPTPVNCGMTKSYLLPKSWLNSPFSYTPLQSQRHLLRGVLAARSLLIPLFAMPCLQSPTRTFPFQVLFSSYGSEQKTPLSSVRCF